MVAMLMRRTEREESGTGTGTGTKELPAQGKLQPEDPDSFERQSPIAGRQLLEQP
jgi:hypothetical protein